MKSHLFIKVALFRTAQPQQKSRSFIAASCIQTNCLYLINEETIGKSNFQPDNQKQLHHSDGTGRL